MNRFQHIVRQVLQILILLDFALIPAWWKWQAAPPPFSANYASGFVLFSALLLTIITWAVSGFAGWRNLFTTWKHAAWVLAGILLVCWSTLSISWAYGAEDYPGMARNASLQLAVITGFALVIVSAAPSPRKILGVLVLSAVLHGMIGTIQVTLQQSLGLKAFGELNLDPTRSGVSIVQSGELRWLRPYGLLPHPNIYAGIIAIGALASLYWLRSKKLLAVAGMSLFLFTLWVLFLTFSRGAWLAFAAIGLAVFYGLIRERHLRKRGFVLAAASAFLGVIFILNYHPLLLARTGAVQEGVEMRSISDRIVYNQIALDAIQYAPLTGIGAGNFPWYASNYLYFRTDYDLRGDHVHNIYLSVLSELGIIGMLLFAAWFSTGIMATLHQRMPEQLLLLAGVIFFLLVGMVDHYPWTLLHTQTLWIGIFAAAIHPIEQVA